MVPPTVLVRPAQESDISQVHEIIAHYVEHTIITFRHTSPTPEADIASFHDLRARNFPYLVAVESQSPSPSGANAGSPTAAHPSGNGAGPAAAPERILGFANAHPFRGPKEGYFHTLELTIFARPEATGQGRVGPALMDALLAELRKRGAAGAADGSPGEGQVKVVLACMSIDDVLPARDAALKRFYERYGFEERGHLKRVGWKFGRWIDTRYMQLEL